MRKIEGELVGPAAGVRPLTFLFFILVGLLAVGFLSSGVPVQPTVAIMITVIVATITVEEPLWRVILAARNQLYRARRARVQRSSLQEHRADSFAVVSKVEEAIDTAQDQPLLPDNQEYGRHAIELDQLASLSIVQAEHDFRSNSQGKDIEFKREALAYRLQCQYDIVIPLYEQWLDFCRETCGQRRPIVADGLNDLAAIYVAQGRFASSRPLFEMSLAICQDAFGSEHPAVTNDLNNFVIVYNDRDQYAEVLSLCRRALVIFNRTLGPDHKALASTLNNLAHLYGERGRNHRANQLFKRAQEVFGHTLGPDNLKLTKDLNSAARLYLASSNLLEARDFVNRDLKTHGDDAYRGLSSYLISPQYAQLWHSDTHSRFELAFATELGSSISKEYYIGQHAETDASRTLQRAEEKARSKILAWGTLEAISSFVPVVPDYLDRGKLVNICKEIAECFDVNDWSIDVVLEAVAASLNTKSDILSQGPTMGKATTLFVAMLVGEAIVADFKSRSPLL